MKKQRRIIAGLILLFVILSIIPACAKDINIGIVYDKRQTKALEENVDLRLKYRNAIEKNGGKVIVLSVLDDNKTTAEKLGKIDGLLVPGGADVDPGRYGDSPHQHLEEVDMALDKYEFELLGYCIRHSIPILAICRGHQILNVFMGGSLYQDIPIQHKSDKKVTHRIRKKGESQICFHGIVVSEDSLLYKLHKKKQMNVNSLHHQAIKKPGKDLKITAHTDDGIIEGIEGTGDQFIVGVQFHPEKMRIKKPEWNKLFKAFVDEAKKWKKKERQ
ncbi:MAG: gamma-glutamyl-gamma-aminobutyrate hydrolase family protein [Candidatus Eremiobacteraeota bacterium]|nr:gamma-glutamyl-gamma-aminobutyrate hydrolase family protein [Candidatus Eremiobacteraeota bacterium]